MALSEAQVGQYERDGFLTVEDLLRDHELQPVIDEIASQVDDLARRLFEAGRITSTYADRDHHTRMAAIAADFNEAPGLFQISTPMGPEIAKLWSSDVLLDIVAQFIGPDIEGGAIWNVRPKVPENVLMTVPWHQDCGYLAPEGQYTPQPACWINRVRWAIDVRWQKPTDPTGIEGVLIRGPRMRKSSDPSFKADMMKWGQDEREKYDEWVNRGYRDPLDPTIDGSWYFARWDPDFRESTAGSSMP